MWAQRTQWWVRKGQRRVQGEGDEHATDDEGSDAWSADWDARHDDDGSTDGASGDGCPHSTPGTNHRVTQAQVE